MKIKEDEKMLYLYVNNFDKISFKALYDFLLSYKSKIINGLMKVCLNDKFIVSSIIEMEKGESKCGACFESDVTLIFCKDCSFSICNDYKNKMENIYKCPQCQNINK